MKYITIVMVLTRRQCTFVFLAFAVSTAQAFHCFEYVYPDSSCSVQDTVEDNVYTISDCCSHPDAKGYTEATVATSLSGYFQCKLCTKPIDGQWSEWSVSTCSVTCGRGRRRKDRKCDSPPPSGGGRPCPGDDTTSVLCVNSACSAMTTTTTIPTTTIGTELDTTNQETFATTSVTVKDISSSQSPAEPPDSKSSPFQSAVWSHWSDCSVFCGQGIQERHCIGEGQCVGNSSLECLMPPCPVQVSADRQVEKSKSSSSSSIKYILLAAVGSALVLAIIIVVILILWRTRQCCFQKKGLRLDALDAASVATYTRRHNATDPAQSWCYNPKEGSSCQERMLPNHDPAPSPDADGYEIPANLRQAANFDVDDDHTYEEVTLRW